MLRALIEFCGRQPVLTLLGAVVIAAIGGYSAKVVPIDAIPNVGENQVIVFTEWPGRSPKDVEDQVTYPLSVALLTVPHAESVRGKSMFGYSFVQITFSDGTDFYWARSRVLERLGTAIATLLAGGGEAHAGSGRDSFGVNLLLRARWPARDEPCGVRNLPLTLIIFSQIPIAIFGGMIGLGIYGIEMNTAIWIGLIALMGIAEDDGVVIATYME